MNMMDPPGCHPNHHHHHFYGHGCHHHGCDFQLDCCEKEASSLSNHCHSSQTPCIPFLGNPGQNTILLQYPRNGNVAEKKKAGDNNHKKAQCETQWNVSMLLFAPRVSHHKFIIHETNLSDGPYFQ